MASEPITGVWRQSPKRGSRGHSPRSPPEADDILVLEHTFLRCPGACSGSLSDRSDQTEVYIRYRCYFECKRLNGAGVSHLEVL